MTDAPGTRAPGGPAAIARRARVAWRSTLRPLWRDVRPTFMVAAATTSLVLGTIGFLRLPKTDYDLVDAVYRAIQLFGLGSGAIDGPIPWELQVARILAPVVFGVAAVAGVMALWRSQLQILGIRLLMRNHVVVAGLGDTGARLAAAFHEAGHRVVGIERDASNGLLPGLHERGISVLGGDATDPALLRRARLQTARYLIATTGDDGRNVDLAMVAQTHATEGRGGVLTAFVHLVDLALWRTLKAETVLAVDRPEFRLEVFNVLATGARMMLERHPPFSDGQGRDVERPHVCLVGLEGVGEHLVIRMANLWRNERRGDHPLRLTVAGPDAERGAAELVERHPELKEICELDARPASIDSSRFQRGGAVVDTEGRVDVTRVYVSLASESEALAAALGVHGRPDTRDIPVVVAVDDAQGGLASALRSEGSRFAAHVEPFGVLTAALRPELVLAGMNEVLARAKHDDYVRTETARGHTVAENPSMCPWEDLPESLRDSNRRYADGVGAILEAAGYAVVPAPFVDVHGPLTQFDPGNVERLARFEHDRWMDDLVRDGWRHGDGPKDPHLKLHPLLVPWEKLGEEDKEKDREAIRLIPPMLARAGFELCRIAPGQ